MRKIEGFVGIAPRLRSGEVKYSLWIDDDGALYVQMLGNIIQTSKPGSVSKRLFRVADYLGVDRKPHAIHGFNPETFQKEISGDHDDFYFLKAILRQLIPYVRINEPQ